jgi:hypothetical protein
MSVGVAIALAEPAQAPTPGDRPRARRRVMVRDLGAEGRAVRATIDVGYRPDPQLDVLAPADMRERNEGRRGSRIEALAVHGWFRQVQVNVDAKVLIKK